MLLRSGFYKHRIRKGVFVKRLPCYGKCSFRKNALWGRAPIKESALLGILPLGVEHLLKEHTFWGQCLAMESTFLRRVNFWGENIQQCSVAKNRTFLMCNLEVIFDAFRWKFLWIMNGSPDYSGSNRVGGRSIFTH